MKQIIINTRIWDSNNEMHCNGVREPVAVISDLIIISH